MASWQFVGGVDPAPWQVAPPLKQVAPGLRQAMEGCLLIGHGLSKDLAALGVPHPKCAPLALHCNANYDWELATLIPAGNVKQSAKRIVCK